MYVRYSHFDKKKKHQSTTEATGRYIINKKINTSLTLVHD